MNEQKKIIVVVAAIIVIAGGGAWWYQSKKTQPQVEQGSGLPKELQAYESLFKFENFDPNLPDIAREKYFKRFTNATNALRADPKAFNAWLELGKVHKNLNAFEKARDAWNRLGEVSPKNSISFGNVGDLYAWFLHNPKKGEENYLIAIKNEPGEINFRRNLAEIYAKLMYPNSQDPQQLAGQKDKIIPLLEEAVAKASADVEKAEMAALLGSYYRDWGDKAMAVKWYRKVLELDPKYPNRSIIQDEIKKLSKVRG